MNSSSRFFFILILIFIIIYHIYFLPDYILYNKNIIYKNLPNNNFTLTFDDSPTKYTNTILDYLKIYNIKAIFFIISDYIDGNEKTMERIVNEGHEVGNHGTKDIKHILLDSYSFEKEILECDNKLKPYLKNNKNKYFRPGFGLFNNNMIKISKKYNYKIILGNIYPHDTLIKSSTINSWYIKRKLNYGSIIILHDREWTIYTLEKIIFSLLELQNKFSIL
jgi:peptidoglycan/xylan/chitin deacetylase (PgdA/CDA1 family)